VQTYRVTLMFLFNQEQVQTSFSTEVFWRRCVHHNHLAREYTSDSKTRSVPQTRWISPTL